MSGSSPTRLRIAPSAQSWRRAVPCARVGEAERTFPAALQRQLAEVRRRAVLDREADRRRTARDLHDTLGQSLALLMLGLDALDGDGSSRGDLARRVAPLRRLVVAMSRDLDRVARETRPAALDDLGLEPAMTALIEVWSERADIPVDQQIAPAPTRLSAAVEATLYRVLEEALANVARHAQASRVGVILERRATGVAMIVEDDGRGFLRDARQCPSPAPRRLGLLGIRERLALVGGTLEIESARGRGTTLFVHVPT